MSPTDCTPREARKERHPEPGTSAARSKKGTEPGRPTARSKKGTEPGRSAARSKKNPRSPRTTDNLETVAVESKGARQTRRAPRKDNEHGVRQKCRALRQETHQEQPTTHNVAADRRMEPVGTAARSRKKDEVRHKRRALQGNAEPGRNCHALQDRITKPTKNDQRLVTPPTTIKEEN
jgi:hypothetical protein